MEAEGETREREAIRPDARSELEDRAPEQEAPHWVAATAGNHAFTGLVAGGGVLPDGRAHPDVEATIARTRGSGHTLDAATRNRLAPVVGDPLADVHVHTDATADALARAVAARAFTTGSDVYFAHGEYQPASSGGNRLLAHELTHVAQQRGGPTSGPLVVSEPGEPLEVEADSISEAAS